LIDESGFEAFYRRTAAPLRAYVVRVIGNATPADDIVQDAYLRLLRAPPPIDDPEQLRAYVFRIASNLIHDYWRRQRRERDSFDRRASEPDTVSPDIALRLDMTRLFEQLRPQQRQLMWLAYVEGAEHREIAAALGLGERSVRVLLHRARRKLATLLRQRERGAGQQ
jgi:RNA polymerase sigma-70 factor (ECF subfamily)